MYSLPDDFDPQVFAGKELERICFVPYSVELAFDGDISLRVFSEIVHDGIDGDTRWSEASSAPIKRSALMRLVGLKVERAHVESGATLVLCFQNNDTLRVIADTNKYECYHLLLGDREIIVWQDLQLNGTTNMGESPIVGRGHSRMRHKQIEASGRGFEEGQIECFLRTRPGSRVAWNSRRDAVSALRVALDLLSPHITAAVVTRDEDRQLPSTNTDSWATFEADPWRRYRRRLEITQFVHLPRM
jgi:hypothetical protein